jgi:sulfur carrier protein ThiS
MNETRDYETIKRKETKMRVLYINNDGGGFADYVDINASITVEQFFSEKMPGRKPDDFLIRVNRQPVPREHTLQEDDRVTITPTKVEGAVA